MNEVLRKKLDQARSGRKTTKKFLQSISKRKDLDELIHTAHSEEFQVVDCLECANCCKTTSPIFRDVDIDRISQRLGIRPADFTEKYLHVDEDNDWVLNVAPCPFLQEDNCCSIYEDRPRACRDYPHTDRKNMHQILELTYRNSLICPAVGGILERIKKSI